MNFSSVLLMMVWVQLSCQALILRTSYPSFTISIPPSNSSTRYQAHTYLSWTSNFKLLTIISPHRFSAKKTRYSHSYLHSDSSHSPKCITSIQFFKLLRLRLLCSDDEDFKTKANEMSTFFSNCNYSPNTIQSATSKVPKMSQVEAFQPRPKQSTTERTPLVRTYHPHVHRIKRIFLRNFKKILQHEKFDTRHIFMSSPLLAYRRDTNLKQVLVRSSLNPRPNGTHFPHSTTLYCSSVCVIYSFTCTKCSILYIGEICRHLSARFGGHLRSVEEEKHFPPEYHDDDDFNVAIQFILIYPTTQSMT